MYHKTILNNGVRLITAPLHETKTATLLVYFGVGSRYETEKLQGVSHFVEHLMFKGTKKRPTTLDLSKELDGVGAEFNAATGKDYTFYFIKADSRHLDLAIDVLSDMLLSSKFEAAEVKREKGVIVEEINMYEDNPRMYVEDLLEQVMFGQNPLGPSIAGSRESVKALSRKDLLGYRDKFYRGRNAVIGLAGRFSAKQLSLLKRKFIFKSGQAKAGFKPFKVSQTKPQVALRFKETEQVQLAIGLLAYHHLHPKIYALHALSVILGGNMSSRLFMSVRERQGLAYFIRSWLNVYEDTGGLIIQAGLDKARIEKAITLIINELKKIKQGVKPEELRRAKEFLAGQIALNLEDTANLAQWYVQQEILTGKILTPAEKIKKIMAVTEDDLIGVANEVINLKRLNLAIIGPFKEKKQFEKIINC